MTWVLRATRDLHQAQLLAGHTDPRTTRRYALAAILPTLERGMAAFARQAKASLRRQPSAFQPSLQPSPQKRCVKARSGL